MNSELMQQAKVYMQECTAKNHAPARELTEIAIKYGEILATYYEVDTQKVLLALYLAHCIFSNVRWSDIMKNHTTLSSKQARVWLQNKDITAEDINDICKAIELHHTDTNSWNLFYEVVKNAESFKFLTYKGLFVFMHHLWERWLNYDEAKEYAIYKAKQKQKYLTLDKAKKLAESFIKEYENNI